MKITYMLMYLSMPYQSMVHFQMISKLQMMLLHIFILQLSMPHHQYQSMLPHFQMISKLQMVLPYTSTPPRLTTPFQPTLPYTHQSMLHFQIISKLQMILPYTSTPPRLTTPFQQTLSYTHQSML